MFFNRRDTFTFGRFIILAYNVASMQPFWWLIKLHEKLMVIREYSEFVQSEDKFPISMLEARVLMKVIRMSSEYLRFTTINMQNSFAKVGNEKIAIFWVCLGAHCLVLTYPVPFSL